MKRRSLLSRFFSVWLMAVMLLGVSTSYTYAQQSQLYLDKHSFRPGEEIQVHFTASRHYAANAWVGIIPSDIPHGSEKVNDQHDISYQYLNKRTNGTLVFRAPERPGSYDFRMHNSDSNGREVCYVTFQVEHKRNPGHGRPHERTGLYLEKNHFRPGETIQLHFTAPRNLPNNAWIGIVPSHVPHGSEARNDRHDTAYQYINGRTKGVMTFTAPRNPGSYDFRMNDSDTNGREIESITFRVGRGFY